ncbi:hypothetical protein M9H77_12526 [Catharanthus roseus]|uniref:Uncharacterized protein n=1 Tax=Catharanthus roseus TaxID=4058 RepID=A0ACC0BHT9_CATRO|nr:hypothetical protein M9H77_12526 [Catharanthus roseus]
MDRKEGGVATEVGRTEGLDAMVGGGDPGALFGPFEVMVQEVNVGGMSEEADIQEGGGRLVFKECQEMVRGSLDKRNREIFRELDKKVEIARSLLEGVVRTVGDGVGVREAQGSWNGLLRDRRVLGEPGPNQTGNGGVVDDEEELEAHITGFYEQLFTTEQQPVDNGSLLDADSSESI